MQLIVLEIPFHFNGTANKLYPVILQHKEEMILVDGGYAGFLPLLEEAALQKGLSLQQLTGSIITHHDIDHMGVHQELLQKYPSVKIYAYHTEVPYINGARKSLRLEQAEAMLPSLPSEYRQGAIDFIELLKNMQPVPIHTTWQAGDEPSLLPGIQILHTPGHMPGHISLYHTPSQTLITADAIVIEEGLLNIANPHFTMDMPAAIASLHRLAALPIQKLICYHGGVMDADMATNMQLLLARYPLSEAH
jgi:glyoxylase-like metal-dependent hydrolase (beta-lactamase superfamily II)